jgi:putative acyl-CoA dehydrogenase
LRAPQESAARWLTQGIALAVQASLLLQFAPQAVAEAFCTSRLAPGQWGAAFGVLDPGTDFETILQRSLPEASA